MAKLFGNFDKVIGYTPSDIDHEFFEKNKEILSIPRGAGLWLWKPYFILKTLNEAKEGDYIFYLDSGFFITKKIDLLVKSLEKSNQDIMSFSTYYPEQQWTKKSLFERMDCLEERYIKSNQFIAGICLIRNSNFSRKFFLDFLSLASEKGNLSDVQGGVQFSNFIENRNDQSIFSLLCKKSGLAPFRTPFIFGELGAAYAVMKKTAIVYKKDLIFNFIEFKNSEYPTMLHINKGFKFFGLDINIFFVAYIYLKLLNIIPFKSRLYNYLLKMGTQNL